MLKSQKEANAEREWEAAKLQFAAARKVWMDVEIGGKTSFLEHEDAYYAWTRAKSIFDAAEKKYYSEIPSGDVVDLEGNKV